MRIRTYLMCLLAVLMFCMTAGINADAAERSELSAAFLERTTDKDTVKDTEPQKTVKKTAKENVGTLRIASSKSTSAQYNSADLRLLSALIYCEAGDEPYAGKLAVGIVVMNRKSSSKFPGSVKSVVYQKYQFGPVRNGSLNRALAEYDKKKFTTSRERDSIKAAKAALAGTKKVSHKGSTVDMSKYLYFSGKVAKAKITIGGHEFC